LQALSFAGPRDTLAVFDQKQRAMPGAADQAAAVVEKPPVLPVQGYVAMRAAVDVQVGTALVTDREQRCVLALEQTAGALGECIGAAQARHAGRWRTLVGGGPRGSVERHWLGFLTIEGAIVRSLVVSGKHAGVKEAWREGVQYLGKDRKPWPADPFQAAAY
jgi:hypothetical protein